MHPRGIMCRGGAKVRKFADGPGAQRRVRRAGGRRNADVRSPDRRRAAPAPQASRNVATAARKTTALKVFQTECEKRPLLPPSSAELLRYRITDFTRARLRHAHVIDGGGATFCGNRVDQVFSPSFIAVALGRFDSIRGSGARGRGPPRSAHRYFVIGALIIPCVNRPVLMYNGGGSVAFSSEYTKTFRNKYYWLAVGIK